MITQKRLARTLDNHARWLRGEGGQRANLRGEDLRRINLFGADLRESNLSEAILDGAEIEKSNLSGAYLDGASFRHARIKNTKLHGISACEADFRGAFLERVNLATADLRRAIFDEASLIQVNLRNATMHAASFIQARLLGANLRKADLKQSKLYGAIIAGKSKSSIPESAIQGLSLEGAELYGAFLNAPPYKYRTSHLYWLLGQTKSVRAYKLVDQAWQEPHQGGTVYQIGGEYSVDHADNDDSLKYGEGIELADLKWCLDYWKPGYHLLIAECDVDDIAAIPIGSDGVFRVWCCRIVGEEDLRKLGLEEI